MGSRKHKLSDDRRLVARMLAGDEAAFDAFFDQVFPGLYRFALARLGNDHAAAEDVAQSTLFKAIRKLRTFRGEAALLTWVHTFCRYEISAYYRKRQRVPAEVELREEHPEVRAALESLAGIDRGPEAELERHEVTRFVQVVLDHLPLRYGDVLEWKYIRGYTVREIAERLSVSPKAVESLLTRARLAFRDGFTVAGY